MKNTAKFGITAVAAIIIAFAIFIGSAMRTFKHALNLVGGVILLPILLPFAILRILGGRIVVCLIVGAVVIHFVVKCW